MGKYYLKNDRLIPKNRRMDTIKTLILITFFLKSTVISSSIGIVHLLGVIIPLRKYFVK